MKSKGRAPAPAVKKVRKPWLGDLTFPRKPATTWLNDIVVACLSLPGCLEGMGFAAFKASWERKSAALFHITQIGEAASRQPASARRRHPSIDWEALVHLDDAEAQQPRRRLPREDLRLPGQGGGC